MKKPLMLAVFVLGLIFLKPSFVMAQGVIVTPGRQLSQIRELEEELEGIDLPEDLELEGTESAEATLSAEPATSAARTVVEKVTEKKPDITEPEGEVENKLEKHLRERDLEPLGLGNFLQYAIFNAVEAGVPASTLVLVILFPLVAAIIAASRHLIGLRGFGIFTPAVLSVAFVAMGVFTGILLFLVILMVAMLGRKLLRWMKLQYLPRMALLIWFISIGVLAVLLLAPILGLEALMAINIFPILILILLAENFIEVQIGKSRREAIEMTVETIILALISSLVLSLEFMQLLALLHPELLLMGVAVFNIFVGKYVGLRYVEYLKFKKLVK